MVAEQVPTFQKLKKSSQTILPQKPYEDSGGTYVILEIQEGGFRETGLKAWPSTELSFNSSLSNVESCSVLFNVLE